MVKTHIFTVYTYTATTSFSEYYVQVFLGRKQY